MNITLFQGNARQLLEALRKTGALACHVHYEGGNDEGGVLFITGLPEPKPPGPFTLQDQPLNKEAAPSERTFSGPHAFEKACEQLLWQAIELYGHGDWQGGAESRGTLTLNALRMKVSFEHREYTHAPERDVQELQV